MLAERFPSSFATIATEVIKSTSTSSTDVRDLKGVDGNGIGPIVGETVKLSQDTLRPRITTCETTML